MTTEERPEMAAELNLTLQKVLKHEKQVPSSLAATVRAEVSQFADRSPNTMVAVYNNTSREAATMRSREAYYRSDASYAFSPPKKT